jgi:hypothetical protein
MFKNDIKLNNVQDAILIIIPYAINKKVLFENGLENYDLKFNFIKKYKLRLKKRKIFQNHKKS